jgi:pyruvate formate lyase activating enzyme
MRLPLIVDIKRHSLEDGPGIRSVVFFKGCLLRCCFCQNPEAQDFDHEIAFYARKCLHCGACVDACPHSAVTLDHPDRIVRDRCVRCGVCVDACRGGALRRVGRYYAPTALAEALLCDLAYYERSGGGVTLSGGEPALHPEYVGTLLRALKSRNVHVLLETGGEFDYEPFAAHILPHVDTVYFDVKFAAPELHRQHTGSTNDRIVGNLERLLRERAAAVRSRVPLIPGLTDTRANLSAIVALLRTLGAGSVEFVPYNPLGREMAQALGKAQPDLPMKFQQPAELHRLRCMIREILAAGDGG